MGSDDAVGRAAEVRAELSALHRGAGQTEAELRRVEARAEVVAARRARLEEEIAASGVVVDEPHQAAGGFPAVAPTVDEQARQMALAEEALARAEEARRSADADRHRWSARAEALAQALDEARARAGARRLAEVDGVLGALVELVDVDQGCEAAFEAAAGEALSAVLMQGEQPARQALAHLAGQGAAGAVIALATSGLGQPMSLVPGPPQAAATLPEGAMWLREHVRSALNEVVGLLDRLLARVVVVEGGWEAAVDLALERPDLVVVSRQGDRCAGGIWRTGAHGTGATGAALEEAIASIRAATSAAGQAAAAEREAKEALGAVRASLSEAQRAAAERAASVRAAGRRSGGPVPTWTKRTRRPRLFPTRHASWPPAMPVTWVPHPDWRRCCRGWRLLLTSKRNGRWQSGQPATAWPRGPARWPLCGGISRCVPVRSRNAEPCSDVVSPK